MFEVMIEQKIVRKFATEAEADVCIANLQKALGANTVIQKLESEDVLDSSGKKVTDILKPGTQITQYPIKP